MPCGSTVESVCGPCARKARALRMVQCREGWHLTEEPTCDADEPTPEQRARLTERADLVAHYRDAVHAGRADDADELREAIRDADTKLRQLGVRGHLPSPDAPATRPPKRSTRRRQDAPNLPTRKVSKTTVGREFAGRYRPSMFVTLTCDSYGRVREDGTPVDPGSYDYRRAARDAVHFASLTDRWWQNLRRVVGWEVQYFATVEPQRRVAPHLHTAIRGSIPHEVIRQVTAATYHQVWWPHHDQLIYTDGRLPVWDANRKTFVDPDTRQPLTPWDQALDQVQQPAHVVTFGRQVHSKGILGGTEQADRHIGYLTKYLTKSITEIVEPTTDTQQRHADRLHTELSVTPCSPRCGVWLRYGIQPQGVTSKTVPGQCKGRAHRRTTLGLPGRRVLVSRKWSGKTLADHRTDRQAFVAQALVAVGIDKPAQDTSRLIWRKVAPDDPHVPPRAHLLMHAIAERIAWKAEYDRAMLAATGPPPNTTNVSAIPEAA
jgi:replication initiator protein RepSA